MEDLKNEILNITLLSGLGNNKAAALIERLDISVGYKAEVASLMILFETIEKKARKIFNPFPVKERKTVRA